MRISAKVAVIAGILLALAASTVADEHTHVYTANEKVLVFANKMGPFNNPLETYAYFELPGCPPASWDHKFPSLGQALAGDELYPMKADVSFGTDLPGENTICTFTPDHGQAARWMDMVEQQYWYQLGIDGLPVWGLFGREQGDKRMLYTHQHFDIGTNGNHVVFANLTVSNLVPVEPGKPVTFTFSTAFKSSTVSFDDRFRRYLNNKLFEHRIHWFALFNSFMMVVFLAGVVMAILSRTLRNDYARYDALAAESAELTANSEWVDETGWKQLSGDVFRVPPYPGVLCAAVGTGWQLAVLSIGIVLIAIVSLSYTSPGSLLSYGVIAYAVTSYVAGFVSAVYYNQFAAVAPALQTTWMRCMWYTAGGFSGALLLGGFGLNCIATAYDSAQAIAVGAIIVMALLWGLVATPLVIVGTIVGRHRRSTKGSTGTPRVHQIPRIVPAQPWYMQPPCLMALGGLLPFGSILLELYFIFTSFWNYKLYYVYGFLLLVAVMLLLVTACVAVVACYFMLNFEEHRWPWLSFGTGASVAGYIFLYAIYFYVAKTKMHGFFMFAFYFGYMGMMAIGIGLMCGAVAFTSAHLFVQKIYRNVKAD